MSEPTNSEHIKLRRTLAFNHAEVIARTRELLARSMELLRQPVPSTFLGKHEPDKE